MKKFWKWVFIALGILIPLAIVLLLADKEVYLIWETWGFQEDESFVNPDFWNYILLIIFKLSLYIFPSLIMAIGLSIENKKNIAKKRYSYYVLNILKFWFLTLLLIKLLGESILEVDRIFKWQIFESIKDVQTLIGFILTIILKKNIEIAPNKAFDSNDKQ
ncbi:MAG: hypothetical protein WCQ75_04190 [Bacilli bacterium]